MSTNTAAILCKIVDLVAVAIKEVIQTNTKIITVSARPRKRRSR